MKKPPSPVGYEIEIPLSTWTFHRLERALTRLTPSALYDISVRLCRRGERPLRDFIHI